MAVLSDSEAKLEFAKLRKKISDVRAGNSPKHRTQDERLFQALAIARRLHRYFRTSTSMKQAVKAAFHDEKIKKSRNGKLRTRLVKLLFGKLPDSTIGRYAGALKTAQIDNLSPNEFESLLRKRGLENVATKYSNSKPPKRSLPWSKAKPVLDHLGNLQVDRDRKGRHTAIAHFQDGECTFYLVKGAPPPERLVRRAMTKAGIKLRS